MNTPTLHTWRSLCVSAAVVALAGCGGADNSAPQASTPPPPSTSPTPPAPGPSPAPSPAPAPGAGPTYYFSDCQAGAAAGCVPGDNANPGTLAAPKRTIAGINLDTLPAGSTLRFARGGVFAWPLVILDNTNVSATAPLTFEAYGSGPLPVLDAPTSGITLGWWNNTNNDGGYVFRNLRLQGRDANASTGFFFVHNVHDVVIEGMEITNFNFGIQSQSNGPHGVQNVTLRNNSISRNRGMGILGQFGNTLIEGNLFEANNFSGSGFEHGTYLSGNASSGRNVTLRNNRYLRNSVVGGVCQGGNMTFHGQMDGLLIEGNTIVQDAAAPGCWLMSITQGYNSAEWFRNVVVRNNRLVNGGNTGIAANSAPGVRIEGNVIINTQASFQNAISVGATDYPNGDAADGNATVLNNTVCQSGGASGGAVSLTFAGSGATATNNVVVTGAAATTGTCAR